MFTINTHILGPNSNIGRLPIRFAMGIAALLISIPVTAENGTSGSDTDESQVERSTNVTVTVSPDPKQASSAIANFTIHDRNRTDMNVDAESVIVRVMEDGLPDGSERTAATPPFRTVQLDVTPLADLFTPFIDAIAQDVSLEGLSLTSPSKLALTVTITGTHNLIANAVSTWAENQLEHLNSNDDRVGVADYRSYLQQASNIIGAFGGDEVVGLPPASLQTLLRTREINEQHARERDGQSFELAKRTQTMSAYESYLTEFPSGDQKAKADDWLRKTRDSCIGTAAKQRVVFRDGYSGDHWPVMIVVPGGKYRMGSDASEVLSEKNERPIHEVRIPAPLAVGVYEITRDEFDHYLQGSGGKQSSPEEFCWRYNDDERSWANTSGPRYSKDNGRRPAVCVSWDDADGYVEWLSKEQSVSYRLLSEAEWEYVARAGAIGKQYHFGDSLTACDARFEARDGCVLDSAATDAGRPEACKDADPVGPRPVGCYPKNDFGLFDVHGNVWEWVADTWKENYEGSPTDGKPYTGSGGLRVLRGGSWADEARYLRSAMRGRNLPDTRTEFIGFRVARDLSTCPPGVLLSVDRASVEESNSNGFTVTVGLGIPQTSEIAVELSLSGKATYQADYRTDPNQTDYLVEGSVLTVAIPTGESSRTISFVPRDDEIAEGTEDIIVSGFANGMLVKPTRVTLEDNDPRIELSVDRSEFHEGSGSVEVTVTAELKDTPPATLDTHGAVALSFSGVAAKYIDYSVTPEFPSITIKEGDTTGSVTLTFTPVEDEANEGVGETIEIQGTVPQSALSVVSAALALRER